MNGYRLWSEYLNGKHEYKILSISLTLFEFTKVSSLIIAVLYSQNLIPIVTTYFIADSLFKFIIYKIILKRFPPNEVDDPELISYGKKLSLVKIITTISNHLDKILLFYFLGPLQLAIYSFAIRPTNELKKFILNIVDISAPKISTNNLETLQKTMPRKIFGLVALLIPIIIALLIFYPFLYKTLFPKYTESILYAQFFTLVIIFFPKNIIEQIFISHSKTKELSLIKQSTAIFKILMFVFMLPIFGIWGALSTILITELISFSVLYYYFVK
jgi:O-antigen/teichoic acid export membrane protein